MIWESNFTQSSAKDVFSNLVQAWKDERNKVFVLRANEPLVDPKDFFESHFGSIGSPAALAEDVVLGGRSDQRTGEIWTEVRYDARHPDAYRHSANAQPLHTDGSYIPAYPNATLMTCVANAGEGGETTFIDAIDVAHALQTENASLFTALVAEPLPHARSGDRRSEKVIEFQDDGVYVNWNYYCVDADIDGARREIVEDFFNYLATSQDIKSKTHAIKLAPGDAVVWKDRRVLHGRNSFIAHSESERFLWKCAIDVGCFE